MDDFPIWLKLTVYGIMAMTVLYCIYGIYTSVGTPS